MVRLAHSAQWQETTIGNPGVLFDLDETLIDRAGSIRAYARFLWAERQASLEVAEADFVAEFVALDGNGYVARPVFFAELARAYPQLRLNAAELERHFFGNVWEAPMVMSGAADGLRRLRAAGIPIGVVTNGGSANQRRKLERSGLIGLVDGCFISEEVGVKKPDPAIFLTAARALGIDPGGSWFVGDHPLLDILGSTTLGFSAVWIERSIPWPEAAPIAYELAVDELMAAMKHLDAALRL